nr:histidine kinase [Treponema sp.]
QLLGIKDSYELLKPYLILSAIDLFICVIAIIQQAFRIRKNTICILAFSLIDFSFFVILQTIIYVTNNSNKNNSHFANIGFVSFILIQIIVISISAKETILQAQKATKLEEALTQSNIKIMLSQIQPHFLFNSLAAIKQLCNTVPEKAALAIDNFATFLRGNIDALGSTAPLAFSKELNIVKCYLNLEKMRFEERLNIKYDIQETDFFIPALTVQPLVENAVRYGITKKIDGGTIYIATSKTKNNYIVTITDDGLGFNINQKKNDGRSHVGIKNVRSRIKALCGGSLEIYSSPGIGTVVSIIIPDTKKNIKR